MILWQLGKGTHSLSVLKKEIRGISQKMLIEQLKELTLCGMGEKHSYDEYPLHADYSLTRRGRKMLEAIEIMQSIGIEIMQEDACTDT